MKRVNIGQVIKEKITSKNISSSAFAKMLGIQRQNIEKTIFSKNSIDTNLLCLISEILDYDFFQYYGDEDACNKKDYKPGEIKEIKASVILEVGDEKKEQKLSFSFDGNN